MKGTTYNLSVSCASVLSDVQA